MSKALNEQTVLVTGAGRGFGAAIASAFAREGAKVVINYRNSKTAAEALAANLGDQAVACRQTFKRRARLRKWSTRPKRVSVRSLL